MTPENGDDSEQREEQNDDQGDEAIASDALFVAQRTKSLDPARGQITDQPGIGGGRAAKLVANAADKRGQIIFAQNRRGRTGIIALSGHVNKAIENADAAA